MGLVIAGVALIVIGLLLAASPIAAGEISKSLRMVPYSTDERALRYYRYCGVGIAAVGLLIAIALA